jgi:hypothetical protein
MVEVTPANPEQHFSLTRRKAIVTRNKRRGRARSYLYENQHFPIFAD